MDVVKKSVEPKESLLNTLNAQEQALKASNARAPGVARHELPALRHETKDVLQQLQQNVQLLEDLGGRLGYVLSEIRTLIRR